jgi:hypothetical protein
MTSGSFIFHPDAPLFFVRAAGVSRPVIISCKEFICMKKPVFLLAAFMALVALVIPAASGVEAGTADGGQSVIVVAQPLSPVLPVLVAGILVLVFFIAFTLFLFTRRFGIDLDTLTDGEPVNNKDGSPPPGAAAGENGSGRGGAA